MTTYTPLIHGTQLHSRISGTGSPVFSLSIYLKLLKKEEEEERGGTSVISEKPVSPPWYMNF
jgi:hypothetical protein